MIRSTGADIRGADADHTGDNAVVESSSKSAPSEKRVDLHLGKLTDRCGTRGR